jgi:hypothetical protein
MKKSYLKNLIRSLVIKVYLLSSLCLANTSNCANNYEYLSALLDSGESKRTQVAGSTKLLLTSKHKREVKIQFLEGKVLSPQEQKQLDTLVVECQKTTSNKATVNSPEALPKEE